MNDQTFELVDVDRLMLTERLYQALTALERAEEIARRLGSHKDAAELTRLIARLQEMKRSQDAHWEAA